MIPALDTWVCNSCSGAWFCYILMLPRLRFSPCGTNWYMGCLVYLAGATSIKNRPCFLLPRKISKQGWNHAVFAKKYHLMELMFGKLATIRYSLDSKLALGYLVICEFYLNLLKLYIVSGLFFFLFLPLNFSTKR